MELNKEEKDANWYNNYYNLVKSDHYSKSVYYPMWIKALELIKDKQKILDIGCGRGEFGQMVVESRKKYTGFDFSKVAINEAKNLKLKDAYFFIGNIENKSLYKDYDIYILLEVLEHVTNDKRILRNIKIGKDIIFSVPDFDYASHVRLFNNKEEILNRYSSLIKIKNIYKFNMRFLCYAIKC